MPQDTQHRGSRGENSPEDREMRTALFAFSAAGYRISILLLYKSVTGAKRVDEVCQLEPSLLFIIPAESRCRTPPYVAAIFAEVIARKTTQRVNSQVLYFGNKYGKSIFVLNDRINASQWGDADHFVFVIKMGRHVNPFTPFLQAKTALVVPCLQRHR